MRRSVHFKVNQCTTPLPSGAPLRFCHRVLVCICATSVLQQAHLLQSGAGWQEREGGPWGCRGPRC